jgi:alpha-N-arabinofuranosidase
MASYAPLFAHIDGWQWTPNLIWMDNLASFGTPNYYVQQLFSRNRGDSLIPIDLAGPIPTENQQPRFYATAVRDSRARELVLKVVNATPNPVDATLNIAGASKLGHRGRATVLTGALTDENSLDTPTRVSPTTTLFPAAPQFNRTFAPYSLSVLRIPIGR